jgi:hypothetical protein
MPRTNGRGGRNNNPSGRNQYSDWGVVDMVRERPVAAAAAAAGAAAAGLFLWSKRTKISDQLSSLSDQIGEWTDNMRSDWSNDGTGADGSSTGQTGLRSSTSSQRGMSETGGGNSTLGRTSGGGGSRGSASGRGRAQSTAATQE